MRWCEDNPYQISRIVGLVLDRMEFGLWFVRIAENRTIVDDRWAKIIGYTDREINELTSEGLLELIHSEDRERSKKAMDDYVAGITDKYELEYRLRHKEGHYLWVLSRGVVVERDSEGHPSLFAGAHTNISRLKEAESAARMESETLRAVFDASFDGFFLVDSSGHLVDCNETFLTLTGYTRDQVLNRSIMDLAGMKPLGKLKQQLRDIKKLGSGRFETMLRCSNGSVASVEIGISYMNREGGLYVCSCRDISERLCYEERLLQLSILDPLTGVFNRRRVLERLEELLSKYARDGVPLSVVLLDLDRFKSINDNYGHQAGDQVLVDFTTMLRDIIREYDVVGRYGGEEFLMVLDGSDIPAAASIVDRILTSVRSHRAVHESKVIQFTASAGIASTSEVDGAPPSVEALIAMADERLYRAKELGRDRAVWR